MQKAALDRSLWAVVERVKGSQAEWTVPSGEPGGQGWSPPRGDSLRFHAHAQERDLYAAYGILCTYRMRLHGVLHRRYGNALGGDVPVELVVEQALERARNWAFRFDPAKGSLWAWLRRIAENCARNRLQVETARTTDRLDDVVLGESEVESRLAELRRAVAGLARAERLILAGRFRRRPFPDRRLARYLGCSIGHLHNTRCRILKKLRRQLEASHGT